MTSNMSGRFTSFVRPKFLDTNIILTLFDHLHLGVTIVDSDHYIVAMNAWAKELLNCPDDVVRGQFTLRQLFERVADLGEFGEEDVEEKIDQRIELARSTEPFEFERSAHNGRTLLVRGMPTADGGVVIIHTDVTDERKAAEDAEFSRMILNNLPSPIFVKDEKLRYTFSNEAFLDLCGRPREDVIGSTSEAVLKADAAEASHSDDLIVLENPGTAIASEYYIIKPDGSQRHSLTTRTSVQADDGKCYIVAQATDISNLKQKEDELAKARQVAEESAELLDSAMKAMLNGMLIHDHKEIIYANQQMIDMLEVPAELVAPGQPLKDFVIYCVERGDEGENPDAEMIWLESERMILAGENFTIERILTGGKTIIADIQPRKGKGAAVTTYTDVTEERRQQEELREARDKAELAATAKSEFLANMSHEIRTPMNGVLGMAELLVKTELNNKQRKFARTIIKSGKALLTIINDILDFSKIEAGRLELEAEPFQLHETVEDVATLISTAAAEKGIELAVRIQPDLQATYAGDAGRLRQIITNLLGNAVKFTDEGHVLVDVSGEIAADTARLTFSIEDTGIGIPAEKCQTIFDQFSQVDTSATRKHEGTGLGLAISTKLVKLMGGEIQVESEPGKGSRFWFTLNLPVRDRVEQEYNLPMDISNARVLIVDDNEVNRAILIEQMGAWGFSAFATISGEMALTALQMQISAGCAFDAVILDYHMPDMDGLEVAARIRENPETAKLPILLLTSVEASGHESRFEELNINAYLVKPAPASLLLQTMVDILQQGQNGNIARKTSKPAAQICRPLIKESESTADIAASGPIDILIAEDNEVNQIVFTQMLQDLGYSLHIATNGEEAIELQAKLKPRLMLLDVSMPKMSGLDVTRKIRQSEAGTGRHMPIIGVTAHAMMEDNQRCLDAGMDDCLTKPIASEELLETVSAWINQQSETVKIAQTDEQTDEPGRDIRETEPGDRAHLLFVEDNQVNLEVFIELLEDQPFDITTAGNGREAVELFIATPEKYALIIMDIAMPVMNGYEATKAIRAHELSNGFEPVPIIAVSAHVTMDHRYLGLEAGMDDYLHKPIDVDAFFAALEKWKDKPGRTGLKQLIRQKSPEQKDTAPCVPDRAEDRAPDHAQDRAESS